MKVIKERSDKGYYREGATRVLHEGGLLGYYMKGTTRVLQGEGLLGIILNPAVADTQIKPQTAPPHLLIQTRPFPRPLAPPAPR